MRYAVVGAGLSGLSVAFFLREKKQSVVLFDKTGIGSGASGIASGLCHPYPGRHGHRSDFADEALEATHSLIDQVEKRTGTTVALRGGILRKNWREWKAYADLEQRGQDVWIRSGWTVSMLDYLNGLYASILDLPLVQKKVSLHDPWDDFDRVIFATGAGLQEERLSLPIQFVKGQLLIASSPLSWDTSIIGDGHLVPLSPGKVLLGSTYEHHYKDELPDIESTKKLLIPRLESFLPPLSTFTIEDCKAGVRVCRKGGYLPVIEFLDMKRVVFTALGSRGLLYHALYGRHLANLLT